MTRYVGVDLHRRRSVIVVLDSDGTELWTKRIDNNPLTLGLEIEKAGPEPEVVLEATWGWYWAADVISQAGGRVHLAHPLGIKGFENRRVKTDRVDARLLADLLRMGRLPESWIAPESIRHQRELVRYRRKLSAAGWVESSGACGWANEGLRPPISHLWGPGGSAWLDKTEMAEAYETRVRSLRRLIKLYDIGQSSVLLGRTHPETPGVGHDDASRVDHQTRIRVGPLGRGRGDIEEPWRRPHQAPLPEGF